MSSMLNIMYQDTLMNLYSGVVTAIDREVLSYSSLPSNIVEPYASQDVDPKNTMNLTYSAMVLWIDEAKKANYFSKHFVTLSRMIMNGTKTMARGLVTMHGRGEDLSSAPMSIGDLISLSSYHFRKSYLGVIQTAKSKPEISERLLLNQLGWCNTLMRLYKTKEKLEKPVAAVPQGSEAQLPEDHQENGTVEGKNAAAQLVDRPESADLAVISGKADQGAAALREPGSFKEASAYNVIRAFTSFDHHDSSAGKTSRTWNDGAGKKEATAAIDGSKKCENGEALMRGKESGFSEAVRSEKQGESQKSRPDETEKTEPEVRISGKEEIQKGNNRTKASFTDSRKKESPETGPDQSVGEKKESVIGDPDTAHNRSVADLPSEDDLTEDEKKILSDSQKYPYYLSRLRMNFADSEFRKQHPRLSASYQRVLAVIDST